MVSCPSAALNLFAGKVCSSLSVVGVPTGRFSSWGSSGTGGCNRNCLLSGEAGASLGSAIGQTLESSQKHMVKCLSKESGSIQ